MVVTVLDREAMNAAWGCGPGPGVILRTVRIHDRCPVCGGPRGTPVRRTFCEDGEWYSVDCWENPCGHRDMYADVLIEAVMLAALA